MSLRSRVIPNLIQGVSQQDPQLRRDSQCEAQFDCLNTPKSGAVARHGADLLRFYGGVDVTGAFTYELRRGSDEHYLMVFPGGGQLRIFNLVSGAQCTVTYADGYAGYLTHDGGAPRDNFMAQTVDDFTFVAAKAVLPALGSAVASTRPREALLFFKAGAYSVVYRVVIRFAADVYTITYPAPTNENPANGPFIHSNALAGTFYFAMTQDPPDVNSYGVGGSPTYGGMSGTYAATVLKNGVSYGGTLMDAGFTVEINGSLIRIARDDGVDFKIDAMDGASEQNLIVFKEDARSFTELPRGGFEGFTLRIRNTANRDSDDGEARDDYWVHYVNKTPTEGYWQERPAPGTKTDLNPDTMPHGIVNTGLNTFEVRRLSWSKRIAGDGVNSAKDPGFVGKRIERMFYHSKRLAIMWEGGVRFSKARNPFTFFPDTVQVGLADAPIESTLSAPTTVALLRSAVTVDEALYLWAQGCQFRIHSGQEPFRQDTVEAPASTYYEFAEKAGFGLVGSSLYFATETDEFVMVRALPFQQGRPGSDVEVSAHVSEFIPSGARQLAVSDTGQVLYVRTDGAPHWLYVYNFLVQDRQVVLSSWHPWRFPEGVILWCGVKNSRLLLMLQRPDGLALLRVPLTPNLTDSPTTEYRTRMDLRVSEQACGPVSFDSAAETSTFELPYEVADEELVNLRIGLRTTGKRVRGSTYAVLGIGSDHKTLTVKGDLTGQQFYAGFRIESLREESTFYLRGEDGLTPTDRLNVRRFRVHHAKSVYYRVEAYQGAGRPPKVEALKNLPIGTSEAILREPPRLDKGSVDITCDTLNDALTIRLVNDSIYPSRWLTAEYIYEAVSRAPKG